MCFFVASNIVTAYPISKVECRISIANSCVVTHYIHLSWVLKQPQDQWTSFVSPIYNCLHQNSYVQLPPTHSIHNCHTSLQVESTGWVNPNVEGRECLHQCGVLLVLIVFWQRNMWKKKKLQIWKQHIINSGYNINQTAITSQTSYTSSIMHFEFYYYHWCLCGKGWWWWWWWWWWLLLLLLLHPQLHNSWAIFSNQPCFFFQMVIFNLKIKRDGWCTSVPSATFEAPNCDPTKRLMDGYLFYGEKMEWVIDFRMPLVIEEHKVFGDLRLRKAAKIFSQTRTIMIITNCKLQFCSIPNCLPLFFVRSCAANAPAGMERSLWKVTRTISHAEYLGGVMMPEGVSWCQGSGM